MEMADNSPNRQHAATDNLGLKPGEIFWNNYRVVGVIGKGGVSTVYKGENLQTKQFVAIKVLHAHKTRDEELVRRFIREAQTTTRLDHPHAIHILEWGIDQLERPFMIIEYLGGDTLAKRIQKGNGLNYNKALDIMEQVCAAIQEAHSLGIIHRDIKPDNIMLTVHQGVDDWVKVCDFGIARLDVPESDSGGVAPATLTQTGAILGTPMYMSPEQLRGRKADARSDIYSLGCVMYEMLTGKPPFASKNTAEIVVGHLNQTPEMPHRVRLDLNIPEKLSFATLRALAKNPWERPTTVQEFMNGLRKSVEVPIKLAKTQQRESLSTGPTVQTPTPYGMVVDPVRRVCPNCKTIASGSNFKYCLKCGQDNMGRWLPYHDVDLSKPARPAGLRISAGGRRIALGVVAGVVAFCCSYFFVCSPHDLTGHFSCTLDHSLFAGKAVNSTIGRQLLSSAFEMLVAQEGDSIHGLVRTAYGEMSIVGKMTAGGLLSTSYSLEGALDKPPGRLDLVIEGTFDKLARSHQWRLRAVFAARGAKPITDSVKMKVVPLSD